MVIATAGDGRHRRDPRARSTRSAEAAREDDPERASNLEKATVQANALVDQMDKFGLLWGPTFEEYERQIATKLEENDAFPAPRVDEHRAGRPSGLRWWRAARDAGGAGTRGQRRSSPPASSTPEADAEDPEFDQSVVGLVVPHLDYPRAPRSTPGATAPGWLRDARSRRHPGDQSLRSRDGVVMSSHGFETPLGRVLPDTAIIEGLRSRLGDRLFKDELDLLPEHSIELQLPWIRHLFGDVPVVAALLPDPLVPMIENDGGRVALDEFVKGRSNRSWARPAARRSSSSADFSHVGPQFGEPKPVDEARRVEVERHDREHLAKFIANDAGGFVEAMEWCKNPTRWCSLGNMSAMKLAGADEVELVDYRQAVDDQRPRPRSRAIALLGD